MCTRRRPGVPTQGHVVALSALGAERWRDAANVPQLRDLLDQFGGLVGAAVSDASKDADVRPRLAIADAQQEYERVIGRIPV